MVNITDLFRPRPSEVAPDIAKSIQKHMGNKYNGGKTWSRWFFQNSSKILDLFFLDCIPQPKNNCRLLAVKNRKVSPHVVFAPSVSSIHRCKIDSAMWIAYECRWSMFHVSLYVFDVHICCVRGIAFWEASEFQSNKCFFLRHAQEATTTITPKVLFHVIIAFICSHLWISYFYKRVYITCIIREPEERILCLHMCVLSVSKRLCYTKKRLNRSAFYDYNSWWNQFQKQG